MMRRLILSSLAVSLAATALVPWVWWVTPAKCWLLEVSAIFAGICWATFLLTSAEALMIWRMRQIAQELLEERKQWYAKRGLECSTLGGDPP